MTARARDPARAPAAGRVPAGAAPAGRCAERPGHRADRGAAGHRAPEDCGGAPGYERPLDALADPGDPEHDELLEWVGGAFDPDGFDLAETNELLELYDRQTRQRPPG